MTSLSINIDPGQLAKVKFMLAGIEKSQGKVVQQAVNRTLSGVRTDATNEISNVITPTKTRIRSAITINQMTSKDGFAAVKCTGGPLNLIHFKARPTNKGVTVQVKKNSARELIKHAYIARTKSGIELVFWRKQKEFVGIAKWDKTNKGKYGTFPKKYRLPSKALTSLAIPEAMGHEPTMKEILRLGGIRLRKNLEDRLSYELKRLRS